MLQLSTWSQRRGILLSVFPMLGFHISHGLSWLLIGSHKLEMKDEWFASWFTAGVKWLTWTWKTLEASMNKATKWEEQWLDCKIGHRWETAAHALVNPKHSTWISVTWFPGMLQKFQTFCKELKSVRDYKLGCIRID